MRKLKITWLSKCRICGNIKHTVSSIRGNVYRLYDDDNVKCDSCGLEGVIVCNDGYAAVLWQTDSELTHNDTN